MKKTHSTESGFERRGMVLGLNIIMEADIGLNGIPSSKQYHPLDSMPWNHGGRIRFRPAQGSWEQEVPVNRTVADRRNFQPWASRSRRMPPEPCNPAVLKRFLNAFLRKRVVIRDVQVF